MRGIGMIRGSEVDVVDRHPVDGHHVSSGAGRAARFRSVAPQDYSLWMVMIEAGEGSEVRLPPQHGDEAVYVRSGAVRVGGRVCPAGGTVVLESQCHDVVEVVEAADLLHMGPHDPAVPADGLNGPIAGSASSSHVVGPRGWYAAVSPGRDSRYYADSTCPTCRLTLLYTSRTAEYISPTHSHSVDELIHVLWGELHLGNHVLGPGDTLAVEADRRYGFRAPGGFGFLNYRRDASEQTIERGSTPIMEGALVNGFEAILDLR